PESTTTSAAPTTAMPTPVTLPWQRFPLGEVEPLVPGEVITVSKIDTDDPVVFITIDDGFYRDPRVPELLRKAGAVVDLFPIPGYVDEDPDYFREIASLGGSVNSHTMRHRDLRELSLGSQVDEICSSMDYIERVFGSVGPFVRPPFGAWDDSTPSAVARCGGVAIVSWRVTASEGILSTWGDRPIQRGDIILMHFRPTLYDDLLMVFAHLYGLGLTTARLEDYLVVG
ncbi:MAG: polysaccharide deacetylase family protein, partial [Ilumatobacteraceae bacterium]